MPCSSGSKRRTVQEKFHCCAAYKVPLQYTSTISLFEESFPQNQNIGSRPWNSSNVLRCISQLSSYQIFRNIRYLEVGSNKLIETNQHRRPDLSKIPGTAPYCNFIDGQFVELIHHLYIGRIA